MILYLVSMVYGFTRFVGLTNLLAFFRPYFCLEVFAIPLAVYKKK